jgi:hypothetical protein
VIYLGLPSPVAELAATAEGYRAGSFLATFEHISQKSTFGELMWFVLLFSSSTANQALMRICFFSFCRLFLYSL